MSFHKAITAAPVIFDEDRARLGLANLAERAQSDNLATLLRLLEEEAVRALLGGVFGASPYLTSLALRDTAMLQQILAEPPETSLTKILENLTSAMVEAANQADAMRSLRIAKRHIALLTALADLGGVWDVDKVTAALSDAGDALLRQAVNFLLVYAQRGGELLDAGRSGYFILAMGKYGARELNYSSDIDLIAFYDLERVRLKPGLEPAPFFVRLTRDLVKLMQERTADGYVFRTDLRLRPDPASTQIALSTGAALYYYESAGQNWERAAYIKARSVAGDIEAGEAFLRELSPYIWRKYLDYAAIADIHAMKRQIHAFRGHGAVAIAGHNLKVGRGGIREIEFFVQTQQLIAGGRQSDLRVRGTLDALIRLRARGWIDRETETGLSDAYRFLRRIEHRLQMLNDEQTQSLPSNEAALQRVANFAGFADIESFTAALSPHLLTVERHYARLFERVPELTAPGVPGSLVFTGDSDDPDTVKTLAKMGFSYPSSVIATVRGWHYGRYPAMRSAKARERLTELTPALLDALSRTSNPDQALAGFDGFMAELPAGVQLFSLLRNNPGLLQLIADIMGSAPRLARVMSRSRRVFDAVLDPGLMNEVPDAATLGPFIQGQLGGIADFEDALSQARIIGREQAFLIGIRVLTGVIAAEKAGEAYAVLAECLIAALQAQVERLMERSHGRVEGGRAAVIGMGKLGGREMTASSDLDLILVYDYASPNAQSAGPKSLPAPLYYTRYTQRLISALSARMSEGQLYDVDMRLRPSGNAGPVATSLPAFIDYQNKSAWTWEHMALTRARPVSGPDDLKARLDDVIRAVLCQPRDAAKTAKDVRDMRAKIETHKGGKDIWDLKLVRGGLVDIEFIAQYLQLVHAARSPEVLRQNTIEALGALAAAGHLSEGAHEALTGAARLYNALTQILRLCVEGTFVAETAPAGIKQRLAAAAGSPDFARLEAELADRQQEVARLFEEIIGEPQSC